MQQLAQWHEEGRIKAPVTQTFALENAAIRGLILAQKGQEKLLYNFL